MKKLLIFKMSLGLFLGLSQISFSQNSITLNGETIKVKKFLVYSTGTFLNRMEYQKGGNLNLSPFFGQNNATKFDGKTKCEIGYSRLGYLCPEAFVGDYVVDYSSPREFLPLFSSSKSEDSWDALIFDYFTNHSDGISKEFMSLWNSEKYSTNKAKRELLSLPENKEIREAFYGKFIDEVSTATYTKKTKKEVEINLKLEATIKADLNEYLKTNSVDDKTANKIKSETKINIEKRLKATNIIAIDYFSLKFNGTFLGIVNDFAKVICNKIAKKENLTSFEDRFYTEYMKLNKVFLISNMQYVSYKIDKTRIANVISEISQDINASLAKNQIKGLEPSFALNIGIKVTKEINEDFKSEGGYIMQVAESGQFAQIDDQCK